MSSFPPLTTRSPRLTRVSDGKPFLRLLVTSKALAVEVVRLDFHGTPFAVAHRLVTAGDGARILHTELLSRHRDAHARVLPSLVPLWQPLLPRTIGAPAQTRFQLPLNP